MQKTSRRLHRALHGVDHVLHRSRLPQLRRIELHLQLFFHREHALDLFEGADSQRGERRLGRHGVLRDHRGAADAADDAGFH